MKLGRGEISFSFLFRKGFWRRAKEGFYCALMHTMQKEISAAHQSSYSNSLMGCVWPVITSHNPKLGGGQSRELGLLQNGSCAELVTPRGGGNTAMCHKSHRNKALQVINRPIGAGFCSQILVSYIRPSFLYLLRYNICCNCYCCCCKNKWANKQSP